MSELLAVVLAYLIGSISGARLVARLEGIERPVDMRVVVDGTGSSVFARGVSPSTLFARSGARGGIPAAFIDIAKAFVPVLLAGFLFPDSPVQAGVASAVVLGHLFPIYYGFEGGFGISPLIGALLAIDPIGMLSTIAFFAVVGFIVGNAYIAIEVWPVGLIGWFAVFGSPSELAFAILFNILYWARSWREARVALRSFFADPRSWRQRVADFKKYPDYQAP